MFHFGPWGPKNGRNGPIRATGGKNRIDGCDATEISLVLPLGIVRIDEKTARYGPFFAEYQFSPADEFVLVGLVVRKWLKSGTKFLCCNLGQIGSIAFSYLRDFCGNPCRIARPPDSGPCRTEARLQSWQQSGPCGPAVGPAAKIWALQHTLLHKYRP